MKNLTPLRILISLCAVLSLVASGCESRQPVSSGAATPAPASPPGLEAKPTPASSEGVVSTAAPAASPAPADSASPEASAAPAATDRGAAPTPSPSPTVSGSAAPSRSPAGPAAPVSPVPIGPDIPALTPEPLPSAAPEPSSSSAPTPGVSPSAEPSLGPSAPEATPTPTTVPTPEPESSETPAPSQNLQTPQLDKVYSMQGIEGWAGGQTGGLLHTSDRGKTWTTLLPDGIKGTDTFIGGAFPTDYYGFAFYLRKAAEPTLLVSHPKQDDGGSFTGWDSIALPTSEAWEVSADVTPYSYLHDYDASYVMLTSGPALGQMNKSLYRSNDRGGTWTRVGTITPSVQGYPTGITFRKQEDGWISAVGREAGKLPLYRTQDGGKTWAPQSLDIPEEFKASTASSYQPVFDSEDDSHGIFIAEFAQNDNRIYVPYETRDSGETWKPLSYRLSHVQGPPVMYFDNLVIGRTLSADGAELYSMDTYNREDWVSSKLASPLGKVDQLYISLGGQGWALQNGAILVTSDGGLNWSKP